MAMLEVRDLRTSFFTPAGEVKAVNGISFNLDSGKVLGIVGESGSGKSVTAYSILQILTHPGRIIGCVYVNPLNQKTVDDMDKYIEAGFAAVKLNPLRHAYCADAEIIDAVMEKAKKYNIPVCIHSGHPPYSLPWQVGLLAERHPDVKLMMIHMGHGHGVYIDAAIKMALRYPNIYLEMSGMPMPSKLREAYERVGADRIMFGTDTPFHHPTVEMQKVITSGLDKDAQQKIFYENAVKFFGE